MKTKTIFIILIGLLILAAGTAFAQPGKIIKEKPIKINLIKGKDTIPADSLVLKPLYDSIKYDVGSSVLVQEIAEADTVGLANKNDSIKKKLIELQATIAGDSVFVIGADGAVFVHKDNLKKPTGKALTDWLPYIIMFLGIIFLIFVSIFKPLQKFPGIAGSKNQVVQRFFAKTSTFIRKVQITAVSISGICASILGLQSQLSIIPAAWISVVQTTAIVCVAIAGLAQFTSKNPEHSK